MLWIVAWYLVISLCTFVLYGWDKRQAKLARWRVKEHTLHTFELLGGWPGGFAGQRYFHHKWKKTRYLRIFWLIAALHVMGWVAIIYLWPH